MRKYVLGIALGAAFGSGASAVPYVSSVSLPTADVVTDFDAVALADGTSVTNQVPGLVFSPNVVFNPAGPLPVGLVPGISNAHVGNFMLDVNEEPADVISPISVAFAAPVFGASFGFATVPDAITTVRAFLGGMEVENFSQATSLLIDGTAFLGFTDITFDEVQIDVGAETLLFLDNVAIVTDGGSMVIPVPAPFLLLGSALGLMGFLARSRSRA